MLVGLEAWLGLMDWWFAVPAGMVLGGVAASWWCLRRERRAEALVIGAGVVVGACLYIILYVGPAGYELLSTRTLAEVVKPGDAEACEFYALGGNRNSFLFYADPKEMKRVRMSRVGPFEEFVGVMKGERKVYCLVTEKDLLERLQEECPGRVEVVGESGERWLVVNRPAPAAEQ